MEWKYEPTLSCVFDDSDVGDSGFYGVFDGVLDERFFEDWQEGLGDGSGNG